jgi:hypothetical protein
MCGAMNWRCCLLVSAFTLFLLVPSQAIEEPKLSRDEVIRLADAEATKSGLELKSYSVATPSYNRDKGVWIVRYDGKVGKNRAVSSAVHFLIYVSASDDCRRENPGTSMAVEPSRWQKSLLYPYRA